MPALLSSFSAVVGGKQFFVDGQFQYNFDASFNSVEMVLMNVLEVVNTPLGSQVLFRSFGTNWDIIDQPGNFGSYQAQVAVLEACARWEPRANFKKIILTPATPENFLAGIWDLYCELEIDLSADISKVLFGAPGPISVWCVNGDLSSAALPVVEQVSGLM